MATMNGDPNKLCVCTDCILIIANGDCGENTEEHADAMMAYNPDTVFIFGGDDLGFSWSYCQGCGTTLGGDRFTAYVPF
jgi:hypothetical protein